MADIEIITSQTKPTEGIVTLTHVSYALRSHPILANTGRCVAVSVISQFGKDPQRF